MRYLLNIQGAFLAKIDFVNNSSNATIKFKTLLRKLSLILYNLFRWVWKFISGRCPGSQNCTGMTFLTRAVISQSVNEVNFIAVLHRVPLKNHPVFERNPFIT